MGCSKKLAYAHKKTLITFALVVLGWIIFRAPYMPTLLHYLQGICDLSIFSIPWIMTRLYYIPTFTWISIMLVVEWLNRNREHGLCLKDKNKMPRLLVVILTIIVVYYFLKAIDNGNNFIYFQF